MKFLLGILLIIILIYIFYDPEINYIENWDNVDGTWEMTCDAIARNDKWNRMPPKNGVIFKVEQFDKQSDKQKPHVVSIALCDIVTRMPFAHFMRPGSADPPINGFLSTSNTGIDIVSRDFKSGSADNATNGTLNYTFEILCMTKNTMYGFASGPGFDTVVNMIRV